MLIAIGADILFNQYKINKRNMFKNTLKLCGVLLFFSILIMSPWLIWSKINFGMFMQGSGAALIYNARANLNFFQIISKILFNLIYTFFKFFNYNVIVPFLVFVLSIIAGSHFIKKEIRINKKIIWILILVPILIMILSSSLKEAVHYPAGIFIAALQMVLSLIVLMCGIFIGLSTKIFMINKKEIIRNLVIILLFVFLFSFYAVYFWHHQPWYFLSILLLISILLGTIFNQFLSFARNKRYCIKKICIIIFIILFMIFGIRFVILYHSGICPWQIDMYRGAIYLNENINSADLIGSFNSGIYGYFSDKTIINLDGVVNYDIIKERKKGTELKEYLIKEKIRYIIDYPCFLSELKGSLNEVKK